MRVFDDSVTLGGGIGIIAEEVGKDIADFVDKDIDLIGIRGLFFDFFDDTSINVVEVYDGIHRDVNFNEQFIELFIENFVDDAHDFLV